MTRVFSPSGTTSMALGALGGSDTPQGTFL
jgi:hypothetical protein